ncbi:hypothetical protein ACHAO4_010154 [Trichoderma viride]
MFCEPAVPAKVPTDLVIPFRFFDDTPLWKAFILYSMFVFDDVLDPQKLNRSLDALVKRDGWHKPGARLRKNHKGDLEYHVPVEFTKQRPGLTYTHVDYATNAAAHPLASKLPKESSQPAIVCDPDEFQDLIRSEGSPTSMGEYLNQDIPQLGLYIITFKDKTLVTLYWPHTLMDAMGKKALLNAWTLILQGRDDEVVPPQGDGGDPLADLGKNPTEPYGLSNRRLSMFSLAKYGIRNIGDFFRTQENRMVCIPGSFIASLRAKAMEELASAGVDQPFLTEGDVLCALWTRVAISHLPNNSQKLVVLNNAYSLRTALEADLLPKGAPYASNAIGFIHVFSNAQEIFKKPLCYAAFPIRSGIQQLGTRAQVEAFASLWRESSVKLPPLFGSSRIHMITYSNWSKARLYELNFSAATVKPGEGNKKPGFPTYIQNNQFGLVLPNAFPIIGKDNEGNFWLSGYMNKGQWEKIGQQLLGMSYVNNKP